MQRAAAVAEQAIGAPAFDARNRNNADSWGGVDDSPEKERAVGGGSKDGSVQSFASVQSGLRELLP